MITIMPADKAFLQSIDVPAGTDAMVLRDSNGRVSGYATFRMDGAVIELLSVQAEEPLLVDGLIRSVLNTGDCRGATTGLCREENLAVTLRRLEFEPTENGYAVSIAKFFRGDCCCGKEKT
ncbi:MAG: hypothetical protein IJO76_02695 [Clostridia bacterium]|nr:hypothetical protein [Clostridia bacterium]